MHACLKNIFTDVGNVSSFAARFFKEMLIAPFEIKELARQYYIIGVKSLPLVAITGLIMGLVPTIQTRPTLAEFGA